MMRVSPRYAGVSRAISQCSVAFSSRLQFLIEFLVGCYWFGLSECLVGVGFSLQCNLGEFSMCTVVSVFQVRVLAGFSSEFVVLVGGFSCSFRRFGVSNLPPSPQWKGATFLCSGSSQRKGGGSAKLCVDRKGKTN